MSLARASQATKAPRGRPRVPPPVLEELDVESDAPIDRQVYQALRRSLMSGAIQPGSRLSSRSIAGALGVSPMPVREALKRLDADGVLHSSAKSAFVVHDLTPDEYREILQIRLRLEGLVVREAAKRIGKAEVEQCSWLLDRMKSAREWRQVLNYNFRMHFLIYRCAQMPYALALIENIWLLVGPALHKVSAAVPLDSAYRHLEELVAALDRNAPDDADAALTSDILMNAEILLKGQ